MIRRFISQVWLYQKGRTAAFQPVEVAVQDIGYPMLTLVFYCLLASYGFRTSNLTHWVIGNSILLCTNTCVFHLGIVFRSECVLGRLRSIVVSPCNKLALVLANGIGPILVSVLSVALHFLVGSLIFGIDFTGVHPGFAVLTLVCAMTSAGCFGLMISMIGMVTPSIHLLLNIVHYVLMIFTGAEFPVSQLPAAGRLLSALLPMTRSIQAMNLLFGNGEGRIGALLLGELAAAAVYLLFAWCGFRFAEQLCRKNGMFDLF